jgi:hypothetical protein
MWWRLCPSAAGAAAPLHKGFQMVCAMSIWMSNDSYNSTGSLTACTEQPSSPETLWRLLRSLPVTLCSPSAAADPSGISHPAGSGRVGAAGGGGSAWHSPVHGCLGASPQAAPQGKSFWLGHFSCRRAAGHLGTADLRRGAEVDEWIQHQRRGAVASGWMRCGWWQPWWSNAA